MKTRSILFIIALMSILAFPQMSYAEQPTNAMILECAVFNHAGLEAKNLFNKGEIKIEYFKVTNSYTRTSSLGEKYYIYEYDIKSEGLTLVGFMFTPRGDVSAANPSGVCGLTQRGNGWTIYPAGALRKVFGE